MYIRRTVFSKVWKLPGAAIGNRYSVRANWIESFARLRDKKRGNSINDKSATGGGICHPCLPRTSTPSSYGDAWKWERECFAASCAGARHDLLAWNFSRRRERRETVNVVRAARVFRHFEYLGNGCCAVNPGPQHELRDILAIVRIPCSENNNEKSAIFSMLRYKSQRNWENLRPTTKPSYVCTLPSIQKIQGTKSD